MTPRRLALFVLAFAASGALAQDIPPVPPNRPRQPNVRPNPAQNVLIGPFAGSHPVGPGQGIRSITATVKGQRIQIDDRYGSKIEISITRKVDGKAKTEKISAADVAALRSEHPEVAALYQKITGTN